ncbi:MAG: Transcriptional regulator, XRE family [Desulfotomaculum sp. 46_296]|uniref:helix-turn-helix domain-containing protein n=1 Tax=Syntrophothermus sp. TaxID=2736299 RepID=UPI0007467ACC|nr:helix-turn-helix transcriptional regulator [Syntrophothermus sp.]KUK51877.1 MAG: Transcriptional regulator, XRE family [Desulfotomaculum sp. 46_296]NSW84543.1 helix-turn-helix domain-containing protein [Syntrophothermus sp.]
MNPKEFGLYLARLREKAGFESQAALAKASGVWNSTIARIEAGQTKKPDPDTLAKLAPYLNVTAEQLMRAAGYLNGSVHMVAEEKNRYETEAAHRKDDPIADLPPEARRSLEEFKEYILRKYGKGEGK